MALVTRGRLSVQRVEEEAWEVIEQLAEKGGWDEGGASKPKTKAKLKGQAKTSSKRKKSRSKKAEDSDGAEDAEDDEVEAGPDADDEEMEEMKPRQRKRKAATLEDEPGGEGSKPRRSTRTRR